jgi:ABC-2 type transport system ATP-binding protein
MEAIAGLLPLDGGEVLWREHRRARRREFMFYLPDGVRPWDEQYVARVIGFR